MKKYILGLFVLTLLFTACNKDEVEPNTNNGNNVINSPGLTVDLNCHFTAILNGNLVEYTENVNGFTGTATTEKIINNAPDYSLASYFFEFGSTQISRSIKIGLGRVYWDAVSSNDPSLSLFNSFFNNDTIPQFSDNAFDGIQVIYTDDVGNIWTSKQNSPNAQAAHFTVTGQESDSNGDYSKFICNFDCYVYHQDAVSLLWDSLQIQGAELTGWFKR